MKSITNQQSWQQLVTDELVSIKAILTGHNIVLAEHQPHVLGERYLMQAMTTAGGSKLILIGHQDGKPVVVKVARDQAGRSELEHERTCRNLLSTLPFAYDSFAAPAELLWKQSGEHLIAVTEFIEQSSSFLERPLIEQFDFALAGFKAQESARATTKRHQRQIAHTFGVKRWGDYVTFFEQFANHIKRSLPEQNELQNTLDVAHQRLVSEPESIERYGDFLTHTDFVPHNFRIKDGVMYLLDFSSIRFGNKHESWARFLNFMTLYNRELESALLQYVEDNRAPEERHSLQLMRLYRLGEIISYYTSTLNRSEGDLHTLNHARVTFWHEVLKAELSDKRVPESIVSEYQETRDKLRSDSERQRQQGLH